MGSGGQHVQWFWIFESPGEVPGGNQCFLAAGPASSGIQGPKAIENNIKKCQVFFPRDQQPPSSKVDLTPAPDVDQGQRFSKVHRLFQRHRQSGLSEQTAEDEDISQEVVVILLHPSTDKMATSNILIDKGPDQWSTYFIDIVLVFKYDA